MPDWLRTNTKGRNQRVVALFRCVSFLRLTGTWLHRQPMKSKAPIATIESRIILSIPEMLSEENNQRVWHYLVCSIPPTWCKANKDCAKVSFKIEPRNTKQLFRMSTSQIFFLKVKVPETIILIIWELTFTECSIKNVTIEFQRFTSTVKSYSKDLLIHKTNRLINNFLCRPIPRQNGCFP